MLGIFSEFLIISIVVAGFTGTVVCNENLQFLFDGVCQSFTDKWILSLYSDRNDASLFVDADFNVLSCLPPDIIFLLGQIVGVESVIAACFFFLFGK